MPLKLTKEELDALGDDEPIRLVDAPSVFFPYAAITVATLRTEVRKGRLELLRIGGKDFVTKRSIREMRDRCTVRRGDASSNSSNPGLVGQHRMMEPEVLTAQEALAFRLKSKLKPKAKPGRSD